MKIIKLLGLLIPILFFSASVEAQCGLTAGFSETLNPELVPTFTNTSYAHSGGWRIIAYSWNFADGSSSTLPNPDHVYTDTGNYYVCLTVTGVDSSNLSDTCSISQCHFVDISVLPFCGTAAFAGQVGGSRIYCNNTSTGGDSITTYLWKVYEGSTLIQYGTNRSALTTDSLNAGIYSVCLYLTHNGTLCDSACQQFTIAGNNNCWSIYGYWNYTQVPLSDTIKFTSSVDSTDWQNLWTFGDGNSSSEANPVHRYTNSGTYTICRIISYGISCHDTVCESITVTSPCANLTASWSEYVISGTTARFYAYDTNSGAYHIWSFGDGTSSVNSRDTTHTYAEAGTYHVCLYVYAPGVTNCVDSSCENISVGAINCGSINGAWTYSQVSLTDTVHFASTIDSTDWTNVWTFGDGSSSTEPNPAHYYATPDTYTVCRIIGYGNSCHDTVCESVIVANPCASLNAYWSSRISGDTVYFSAYDTSLTIHHIWSFGDGTYATENTAYPSHIYAQGGIYHVCLTTYIPGVTGCTDSVCDNITVGNTGGCASINGAWTYYQAAPYDSVYFSGIVDSSDWSNAWSLSGQVFSTEPNPVRIFTGPGTYIICRTISYGNSCHDTVCQSIVVTNYCANVNPAWTNSTPSGNSVNFYATDTVAALHRDWNFGDGNYGFGIDVSHTYAAAGTYHVCLITYVPGECTDSSCADITVDSVNCHGLTAYWLDSIVSGTTYRFMASDTNTAAHHIWSFGDGSNDINAKDTTHTYAGPGTYTACLYVYLPGSSCPTDSLCRTITVTGYNCSTLTAYWIDSLVTGSTYRFWTYDTNTAAHHIWSFGDGSAVNSFDTTHTYTTAGTYTACLYVYIPNSTCPTDSYCRAITVTGTGCGTASYESYVYDSNEIHAYSNSAGINDSTIYGWTLRNSSGTVVESKLGDTSYIYTVPVQIGTYQLCLKLYNGSLFCDSFCTYINVGVNCGTLTGYWLDSLISGNTYRFMASDTNSVAHHIWSFGDGSDDINARDTTHTYSSPGTYTACLYVYIPGSSCPTDSLCRTITIGGCGTASYSYYIYDGDQIHAYSTSTGTTDSTKYGWTIRNSSGTTIFTQLSDTNYIRSQALANGTYQVCLALYNGNTRCDSICQEITINNRCLNLNANWTWNQQANAKDSIEFHSAVDSTDWSYLWIFGDGTTSTEPNVIHGYAQPGTYTVCHVVTLTSIGCSDTICQSITVTGTPNCGTANFSYYIYGSSSIHAYSTSTGVPSGTVYTWYLWNSNNSLIQSQSGDTTYLISPSLTNGTYKICLYLSTGNNLFCDSICESITIDSSTVCSGLSAYYYPTVENNGDILFTPSDTLHSHTHYWVFGDGSTSTDVSPTHAYAHSGVYQACLYISIPGTTCLDSFCRTLTISASQCNAGFTYIAASDTLNTLVFTNTSTASDSVSYYRWAFGDGTISYLANPTHTYPNSGTYYTCLSLTTVNGCTSTYCDSVTVQYNPCYGLTAAWTSTVLQDGNIQFKSVDSSTAIHRYWTFGDGGTSTNYDPVHAYANPGAYTVCLLVYVPGTTCIDSSCSTIQVGASGCSAGFTYQSYYPPYDAVRFTNTSTSSDSIISYYWTFGDNTSATFENGTHTYPHSGYWYACLTITTIHGCSSTYCDTIFVQYDPCFNMSASWTYTYTNVGGVQFTSETTPAGAYNLWNFGDGTSSTEADPLHYYAQPGTYNVCHITGISGSCADTSCQSIQGTNTGGTCHANFTYATDTLNNHAYFTNTSVSSDSIISDLWNFGDDSTSTAVSPYHAYANAGTYYVCLTITTASGCSSTYCDSVTVHVIQNTGCSASFTWTVDTCQLLAFTNTSTGDFTRQYWLFGDGSPADTAFNATHLFPAGTWTVELTIYGSGGCTASHSESITVNTCGSPNDTVCGTVFDDANGNGIQDQGEKGVANAEIHIGSFVVHADSSGHYTAIVPAGTYTIYYCAPDGYTFTIPVGAVYDSSGGYSCADYSGVSINSGSNCGFNFGIKINSITICGTVYFDANDNHVQDPGEAGIANAEVILIDTGNVVYTVFTDQYGHYCAVVPVGSYVLTISANAYQDASIYPSSITISSTVGGQTYSNNNFGVYVQPGACDLSISVTANTSVTPGFPAWYEIEVCNVGTNVTSGTVNMFYDPGLVYNYASPVPSSENPTTFTISWTLTNLLPGSCQYYWISTTADSTLTINQPIFTLASVTTSGCNDINLSNNVDTLHQYVTASWDPNNKTVSPLGEGPSGAIKGSENLIYTINFQNTGTATAVNIVVHDTLSSNLDIKSFKMMGASAPFTSQFSGNVVIWKFNDIMLPDSAVDQLGSYGFVSYSINPLQNLPQGTQITNSAALYFDYNAGVSTNTTLNTIDYTLAINDVSTTNTTITLMPNPFSQYTLIRIEGAQAPYEIKIYDAVGREVRGLTANDNIVQIDRGDLASGMYMYQITQSGKVIGQGKMIAE